MLSVLHTHGVCFKYSCVFKFSLKTIEHKIQENNQASVRHLFSVYIIVPSQTGYLNRAVDLSTYQLPEFDRVSSIRASFGSSNSFDMPDSDSLGIELSELEGAVGGADRTITVPRPHQSLSLSRRRRISSLRNREQESSLYKEVEACTYSLSCFNGMHV